MRILIRSGSKPLFALLATAIALGTTRGHAQTHALNSLERVRAVPYAVRDGNDLLADVYMPPGPGPYPAILMVHGGAWAAGSKWAMLNHANEAAQHGFTTVAINYRLAPKHKFPAQLHDCRDALSWMRRNAQQYKIDPARIGAYGYSAGGHLVALLAVTLTAGPGRTGVESTPCLPPVCVVAGGAPCGFDWLAEQSRGLAYFLGGSRAERPATYHAASPNAFVTKKSPPFFLFHAEKDQIVPRQSSRRFHEQLRQAGVASFYHVVPEKGHLLAMHDSVARKSAIAFLKKQLGVQPTEGEPNPARTSETQAPTTQAPTTQAPTTQAPTTQAPTREHAKTANPASETPRDSR